MVPVKGRSVRPLPIVASEWSTCRILLQGQSCNSWRGSKSFTNRTCSSGTAIAAVNTTARSSWQGLIRIGDLPEMAWRRAQII